MRNVGMSLAALGVIVCLAGLTVGQPPPRGGLPGPDPLTLLRDPNVKKELNLTDDQAEKLPDAVRKALADVLKPDQLKRLGQIELQQRGSQAFTDPQVQTALKLSDAQKEKVKSVLDDSRQEMLELFKGVQGGNFQEVRDKMTKLRTETTAKVTAVLDNAQKKLWSEMVGTEFKMDRPFFRPGGDSPFKKKDRKKDD